MLFALTPVLHTNVPEQALAVKVAVSALHKLFFVVLITGADGLLPVVIITALLTPLAPQLFTHVAV